MLMSTVTNHLLTTIARQVAEQRMVLWLDPERNYVDLVAQLALSDTAVAIYSGSFFALRYQIDVLLASDNAPRLVVYVPRDDEQTLDALAEFAATAALMRPGQSVAARNTRLSVVARRALREKLGDERAEELARQVEAGQLRLADLDRLDDQEGGSPVIAAIFGTSSAHEVTLRFLSSNRYDEKLLERRAQNELARVLGPAFGINLPTETSCDELRTRLARYVLTSEFLAGLQRVPPELATITLPEGTARQACINLSQTWRLRRDLQESYARMADIVSAELGLAQVPFSLDEIQASETFATVEATLQAAVEQSLITQPTPELIDLVLERQSGFWSTQRPVLRARWALTYTAGQLLAEAAHIEQQLKETHLQPESLLRAYVEGDRPWCLLDTYQRTLERRWHTFDLEGNPSLEALVARARQRFMAVGGTLAEYFTRALAATRFAPGGIPLQREIFARFVQPAIREGKIAYVLVDAMRFEMARELTESLGDAFSLRLDVALGTLPSITPVGMAALMPGAENGTVVLTREGKIALQIGDTQLKDRRSRIEWFRKQVAGAVAVTTLEDMLPKPKSSLHAELLAAEVILVTSQEIDELAESDNIRLARKVMDDALADLARLVRKLRDYNCQTIVLTADHGYLFGDEVESDMKIDAPGGQAVTLKRRVWVGRGAENSPSFLRAPLSQLGLSDSLEIAVPWGFGVFKASGARAYFHGGAAPQELAIPVLTLTPLQSSRLTPLSNISWSLTTGSKKLSTRFFSVQIGGQSNGLFELDPPRVRVELRSRGTILSQAIGATYGLSEATGEIELRTDSDNPQRIEPNTITLMVNGSPGKTISLHLLDAMSGRELERLDRIEAAILDL